MKVVWRTVSTRKIYNNYFQILDYQAPEFFCAPIKRRARNSHHIGGLKRCQAFRNGCLEAFYCVKSL